jgi:hypothetical protein
METFTLADIFVFNIKDSDIFRYIQRKFRYTHIAGAQNRRAEVEVVISEPEDSDSDTYVYILIRTYFRRLNGIYTLISRHTYTHTYCRR